MSKYVYFFGEGKAEGNAKLKNLLGGKGANLAEMTNLAIPVPAGFTITTEVCTLYNENKVYPKKLDEQVNEALEKLENAMGKKFGDLNDPLLVSVRSGARVSMPGMMDTVLNLGLNDEAVNGLIEKSGNERFAWDSYRRFIQMFSNVVKGLDSDLMEHILENMKNKKNVENDTDLDGKDLKELVRLFKAKYKEELNEDFPQDPKKQLWSAITAVFGSWNNERAIKYRKINNIPGNWGTAVNVQAMVFGNMGQECATGVAFTRDPATGEKVFFGEYLINAQGEDVVAGIRTPQQVTISGAQKWAVSNNVPEEKRKAEFPSLEESMPVVYKELENLYKKLENHYREMQDLEFTIQNRKLYLLQTRTGKRTAGSAIKIAVDMVEEGLITKEEAVLRILPGQLDQLLHPMFDPKLRKQFKTLAKGLPASPGAATGKVVFYADDAVTAKENGEKVILVRLETSPEDIGGMDAAQGILTARGGMTSHAAVVARGMGKCCVAGCGAISINYSERKFSVGNITVNEFDVISLDGSTGEVILGQIPTIQPKLTGNFGKLMGWADSIRTLGVRTNADTPHDSKVAIGFGAEGIGLTRTEHMFFEGDRITAVREMILADSLEGREKALEKLLPIQKKDFLGILEAMADKPVTIRLLDPPLHEFLPHTQEEIEELAYKINKHPKRIKQKLEQLKEFNPMLGHRGCRLGITYPEISKMQATAIMEAACELTLKGFKVYPEIMIPLTGTLAEVHNQKMVIKKVAEDTVKKYNVEVPYLIGTMIEIPRACLVADKIATEAEFFSFGTNDLTQMTFGYSRDDAGVFLPEYVERGILPNDPFQSIDIDGVGQLVKIAIEKGRKTNPKLKIGICGEHGGDPASVTFCHKVGMNYVSCSPYRVPIARLAAAHAVLNEKK